MRPDGIAISPSYRKIFDEVAGEHAPHEQKSPSVQVDHLRRGEAVFAVLLDEGKATRVARILVTIQRIARQLSFRDRRLTLIHA